MNSGAPASMAPPQSASAGMMVWQSACSVLYWFGGKNFGGYAPLGAAAFSASTILCACSAASAGMTRSTEPANAPMVSDFKTSRRDNLVDMIRSCQWLCPVTCHAEQAGASVAQLRRRRSIPNFTKTQRRRNLLVYEFENP